MAQVKAEDYITMLAEIVIENKALYREVNKLVGLAKLEMIDIGNDIDAVDALRDTFIYLSEKIREDSTATGKKGK